MCVAIPVGLMTAIYLAEYASPNLRDWAKPIIEILAGIPTVVTSYQEYQSVFGDVIRSGSDSFQFLTSHAAEEYLKNSDTLTVIRIMDGTFGSTYDDDGNRISNPVRDEFWIHLLK